LVEEGIEGNPEIIPKDKLHEKAWKIVEPIFTKDQKNALEKCVSLLQKGDKTASSLLEEIVPAASNGRVDTLFVAIGIEKWGRFNPESNQIIVHEKSEASDIDLLDFSATQTLNHGGIVYALETENIPNQSMIAAIFRY